MALTFDVEQRLIRANLATFFNDHQPIWLAAAKEAHEYLHGFSTIRPDDVAKVLHPIIEVNVQLQNTLATKRLTQKYWTKYFVDLIFDKTWQQIHGD